MSARVAARRSRRVPGGLSKFGLFAEVLLTGVYIAVLSLPVVTALPAVTTGVAHLRRYIAGMDDGAGTVWSDFKDACRGVWLVALGVVAVFFLLALDLWAVSTGALPGGRVVGGVSVVVGLVVVVGLLRAAGAWQPGASWPELVRGGVTGISGDPIGSVMLVAAVGMCAVLVWMLAPLVFVVGGLLAFAVVAMGFRAAARSPADERTEPTPPSRRRQAPENGS